MSYKLFCSRLTTPFFRKPVKLLVSQFSSSKFQDTISFNQNPIVKVGNYHINYLKSGHGPHVVFCFPGILGSMKSHLPPLIQQFNKDKFTLLSWDQAGYGYSSKDRIFNDESLEEDADLLAEFMNTLGYKEPYSIMGWSGGGISAIFFAIKYPHLARKLVAWDAFSFVDKDDADNYAWYANTDQWSGKMKEALVQEFGDEFFKEHFGMWMKLFIRRYTQFSGELCASHLHKIQCPTLILHGKLDTLVFPKHGTYLRDNIKGSILHSWEKGKHNIHLRYPDEFNIIVQKFLLQ